MTIDQLYEAFMDIDEFGDPLETKTPFAEDVFGFFGKDKLGGLGKQEWAARYEMYFPTFDPAQTYLAERERDLSYRSAMDTLKTTQEETDRVYSTEMDTLSTTLGRELSKGREMAGRIGLRSGDLESAIQDTIATTGSKAKDFGDRVMISEEEIDNKYNNAMVDAALDYDKTVRQEKEEFYDRTMAAIMRLMDTGAFDSEEVCDTQCTEICAPPLMCNLCTGECQIGEITEGWEAQIGACTESMELSGCETHGDKCFCPEVIADQAVTTKADAFGCACSMDVGGAAISCSDSGGNDCVPDWSTSGDWCDPSITDCGNPASCNHPCGDDVLPEVPSDFGLEGYGCTKVYPECGWWDTMWSNCGAPTCYYQFQVVSCDSSVCTGG